MSGDKPHDLYDRRRGRNLWVAAALAGVVALLFTVTVVKLQEGQNARSPFYEYWNPNKGVLNPGGGE